MRSFHYVLLGFLLGYFPLVGIAQNTQSEKQQLIALLQDEQTEIFLDLKYVPQNLLNEVITREVYRRMPFLASDAAKYENKSNPFEVIPDSLSNRKKKKLLKKKEAFELAKANYFKRKERWFNEITSELRWANVDEFYERTDALSRQNAPRRKFIFFAKKEGKSVFGYFHGGQFPHIHFMYSEGENISSFKNENDALHDKLFTLEWETKITKSILTEVFQLLKVSDLKLGFSYQKKLQEACPY